MSEIREKVDQELKTVNALCDTFEDAIKAQVSKGLDKVSTHEMYEVIDIYKDLSEVKKNIVEMCYKKQIMDAMEGADYGIDYDESGMIDEKRFYDHYRYADGTFAPKGRGTRKGYRMTPEMYRTRYRDMDMSDGRMYYDSAEDYSKGYNDGKANGYDDGYKKGYSDGTNTHTGNTMRTYSRSEMARRNYEDAKTKEDKMQKLDTLMESLYDEAREKMKNMSADEKQMMKNKMDKINTLFA